MTGIGDMLSHPFMQHAFVTGTSIALLSGLVGFFVVLRGQVFAGDALSHVAYAGALAALAAGVDLRFGLFAATITVGLVLGFLGGRGAADDAVIGTTFAWMLGLGVFFLAYYTTHGSGSTANGNANVTVLFGSIFGISAAAAATSAWIAAGLIVVLVLIARPLLFASLDPAGPHPGAAVSGHRRRHRRRSEPGRRRTTATGPTRRTRRCRSAAHRPTLGGVRPGRVVGRGGDVGRPDPVLPPGGPAAQFHHHGHCRRRIRGGRRGVADPSPRPRTGPTQFQPRPAIRPVARTRRAPARNAPSIQSAAWRDHSRAAMKGQGTPAQLRSRPEHHAIQAR